MNDSGMPSLLMQAARSAAQADGVAPPPDTQVSGSFGDGVVHDMNGATKLSATASAAPHSNNNVNASTAADTATQLAQQRKAMQAQHSSSSSAGGGGGGGGGKKKGLPLRRGKWTPEEEAYANRLIQEFKAGLLPLTDGTTLRTFLSKLLNCDPMRISKKFVGSNCIGKQVFRRRTADLNRLTPDQIQKSRAELSELERRFLERVAQTNRVKNSNASGSSGGVNNNNNNNNNNSSSNTTNNGAVATATSLNLHHAAVMNALNNNGVMNNMMNNMNNNNHSNSLNGRNDFDFGSGNNAAAVMQQMMGNAFQQPSNPPWLQPPLGYEQGMGAQMAAANLAGSGGQANSRAAAAGRALLGGLNPGNGKSTTGGVGSSGSNNSNNTNPNASLLAMAALQRRASQQALMNAAAAGGSTQNLLAALSGAGGSGSSLAQMARNASALAANGNSFNNLMLKTGFSRDQLSQLARERGLSSASLSNMVERKSSFDALMSLDFQSLQSIDNLANLIQTGGGGGGFGQAPSNGMKNWSADISNSNQQSTSSASLSNAARRLASATNLESLMRSLSNNTNNNNNMSRGVGLNHEGGGSANDFAGLSQPSNANLQSLLQSMSSGNMPGNINSSSHHNHLNNNNNSNNTSASMSSLLGANNGSSAASLANLLRDQSSTGLSALRMQDGLNNRNSSVEDFLSLVAAGDIPHQDPSMLNLSLSHFQQQQQQQQQQQLQQQQQQNNGIGNVSDAAAMLAQQQQHQQQLLAQATGNNALANALASRSFGNFGGLSHSGPSGGNIGSLGSTAELLQQMADAASNNPDSFNAMKRKLLEVDGGLDIQESSNKR